VIAKTRSLRRLRAEADAIAASSSAALASAFPKRVASGSGAWGWPFALIGGGLIAGALLARAPWRSAARFGALRAGRSAWRWLADEWQSR
jgi:MFS family permease